MIRIIPIEREYGSGAAQMLRPPKRLCGTGLETLGPIAAPTRSLASLTVSSPRLRNAKSARTCYYRLLKSFILGSCQGILTL